MSKSELYSRYDNLVNALVALGHTSYGEMCNKYDALEQEAREDNVGDPQDLASAQFFANYGYHLEDAFEVYVAQFLQKGRDPVMPDGTPITVTTVGRQRMTGLLDALTA